MAAKQAAANTVTAARGGKQNLRLLLLRSHRILANLVRGGHHQVLQTPLLASLRRRQNLDGRCHEVGRLHLVNPKLCHAGLRVRQGETGKDSGLLIARKVRSLLGGKSDAVTRNIKGQGQGRRVPKAAFSFSLGSEELQFGRPRQPAGEDGVPKQVGIERKGC